MNTLEKILNITTISSIVLTVIGLFGVCNSIIFIVPFIYVYQSLLLNGLLSLVLLILIRIIAKDDKV